MLRPDPRFSLTRVEIAGAMCKNICAAALLVFALGCNQHTQVSEVTPGGGTNAEPATKPADIVRTNYAPERFPTLTNATTFDDNTRRTLISIWRSPDSTPDERVDAITKWLPKGSSIDSVIALLGNDGDLSHNFGPFIDIRGGKSTNGAVTPQTGAVDFWFLEYDTPHGKVTLRFYPEPVSTNQNRLRFDRAFAGKEQNK